MVKSLIVTLVSCLSLNAQAADWDFLKSEADSQLYVKSYSGVLLDNQAHHNDSFDLWLINTGYQYPLHDGVSLYMEAGRPSAPAASNRATT